MPIRNSSNPYEIYCHRCKVSFPTEQRHCIHCGGRLSNERLERGEFAIPFEPAEVDSDVPAESGSRLPFSPLAIVWAVLLIGGSIYRGCVGE